MTFCLSAYTRILVNYFFSHVFEFKIYCQLVSFLSLLLLAFLAFISKKNESNNQTLA